MNETSAERERERESERVYKKSVFFSFHFRIPSLMNGNHCMCNQNQMSKNLPLKKRRAYLIDPPLTNNENYSKIIKPFVIKYNHHRHSLFFSSYFRSYSQDDSCSVHVPTPPSSPHIDFSRQQHVYLSGNSTNILPQNYHYLMAQQYLDHYRLLFDQQQQYGYTIAEGIWLFFFLSRK
jgi:hypothetical protein